MKTIRTITEVSGFNDSPVAGEFITSGDRDFVAMGVTVASTLTNAMTGLTATVTAVSGNRIDATGLWFNPGDFFYVDCSWVVQNTDGPTVDVECKRCGWSYPAKDLVGNLCKTCIDK